MALKRGPGPEPNRNGTIEMPAGEVTDRISHGQQRQSESQTDSQESDASDGKPAASTALPQPANVSQKVPKNSAPRRRHISWFHQLG